MGKLEFFEEEKLKQIRPPFFCVNKNSITDYVLQEEIKKHEACFIWLASSRIREDIKDFEDEVFFPFSQYNNVLSFSYHYNKSPDVVRGILKSLKTKEVLKMSTLNLSDLPILILSRKTYDPDNLVYEICKSSEDVVFFTKDFLNDLLKLDTSDLKEILDNIYLVMAEKPENINELEKNVKNIIREKLEEIKGKSTSSEYVKIVSRILSVIEKSIIKTTIGGKKC